MSHERSILAAFQRGESRMIFAGKKSGEPGLFYLPEGGAAEHKSLTLADLRCPVEDCPNPDFTTVNRARSGRRDGFRHLNGNFKHAPESLFHLEGKAQIARYLKAQHPTALVVMEQASNSERERIADVMVTFADKTRMAIEIQYSALTAEDWQARHNSYQNQNITDVWLFGHSGAQLRAEHSSAVSLTPAQTALAAAGGVPLWFNPLLMHVGIATTERDINDRKIEIYEDSGGNFTSEPLANFTLHPNRLSSRRTDRIATDTVAYLEFCTAEEEKLRLAKELKTQLDRENREFNAARRVTMQHAWFEAKGGQAMLELFDGKIPKWLGAHVPGDIPVPNVLWQWHLWQTHIAPADRLDWVRPDLAIQELEKEFGLQLSKDDARNMITSWYDTLVKHSLLSIASTSYRFGGQAVKYVKKQSPGLVPFQSRMSTLRSSLPTFPPETVPVPRRPVFSVPLPKPEIVLCGRCRQNVAEPYARTGYHMRCTPGYTGF